MALIDKDALIAEIESKIEKYTKRGEESDAKRDGYGMYWGGVLSCLNEVRTLCDALEVKEVQEEPVSEDLEKALLRLCPLPPCYNEEQRKSKDYADSWWRARDEQNGFRLGAFWQKQQMIKDAIEAEIINWASMFTSIKVIEPERAEAMIKEKFDIGDKVKLIIVKEE